MGALKERLIQHAEHIEKTTGFDFDKVMDLYMEIESCKNHPVKSYYEKVTDSFMVVFQAAMDSGKSENEAIYIAFSFFIDLVYLNDNLID